MSVLALIPEPIDDISEAALLGCCRRREDGVCSWEERRAGGRAGGWEGLRCRGVVGCFECREGDWTRAAGKGVSCASEDAVQQRGRERNQRAEAEKQESPREAPLSVCHMSRLFSCSRVACARRMDLGAPRHVTDQETDAHVHALISGRRPTKRRR